MALSQQIIEENQFNAKHPVGTEVIYFPNGDCLPIVTTKTNGKAFYSPSKNCVMVGLECLEGLNSDFLYAPIHKIETCSQDQFDDIVKILDRN